MDRSRHPPPYGLPPAPPQPQQPSFDPFQRRDPFLPTPQQEKREDVHSSPSYRPGDGLGSLPRPIDFPIKDSLQHSHPQPPSPFHGSGSVFRDEHLRRRSLGGGHHGGPVDHSGQHAQPPPPPPSNSAAYSSRHAGPHGSSPVQSNGSPYATSSPHATLPAPQQPTSREEPPRHYPSHRPNTSMSISSIMGSDHPTIPQPSQTPIHPPSTSYSQGGPSWTRSPLAAVPDVSRRPRTPDRFPLYRSSHPNSGISSPEQHRLGSGGAPRPPFGVASPTSSNMPPRPFSQPAAQEKPFGHQPDPRRDDNPHGHPYAPRPLDQDRGDRDVRDRGAGDNHGPRPIISRHDPTLFSGGVGGWRAIVSGYGMAPEDARPEVGGPRTPLRASEVLNREEQRHPSSQAQQFEPVQGDNRVEQLVHDAPGRSTPRSGGAENSLRKSIEDAQGFAPRGMFNSEFARRFDRGSPLPQAVQGVSAQPVGIGRDPGIRGEFTRIFSGLGSGVGSTPQPLPPNGIGTPGRGTPAQDERDGESHGGQAAASSSKRGRKAYEAVFESDSGDGRSSPIPGRPSAKKAKQQSQQQPSAAAHHHHHLPHTHHHHHHHRKADGEPLGALNRQSSYTPFNTLKHGSPTSQPNGTPLGAAATAAALPHHHHHHGPHHHHHHHHTPQQPPLPPPAPLRRPLTTIKTKPLLESIAHLPRKHLGSQLYAPAVCAPPSSHPTPANSKDAVASKPNTIPRFEGKENCTYTIRISRIYLTEAYRELLCRDRRIWGTDVYTDDSDPLAASIHSGWILGAWPKDVDISLLDLQVNPASAKAANDSALRSSQRREVISAPPDDGPLTPPQERDLHLTVLILPPLQKYASSVWHGIKSRSWGDNHDGMSFKIERLEWVDEGVVGRTRGRDVKSWKASINESRTADGLSSTTPKKSKTLVNGSTNGATGSNGIGKDQPGAPLRAGVKAKGTTALKAGKVARSAAG